MYFTFCHIHYTKVNVTEVTNPLAYLKKGFVTLGHIFYTKVNVTKVTNPIAYLKKFLLQFVTFF
jgi:hypothetical protein